MKTTLRCSFFSLSLLMACGDSSPGTSEGTDTDSGTGTASNTDDTSATATQTASATQTGTDSATQTGTDTGTDSATQTGTDTATQTGTDTGTDSATQTGTDADTDPTTGTTDGTTGTDTDSGTTGDMTTTGTTGDMTTTGTTGDMTTTGTTGDMTTGGGECQPVKCGNKLYECGDCEDNDNDGKIDGEDVECISPCDDDEGSFATGLPGDNMDPCKQDCFFDGNSGSGDDKCEWNLACDPNNPGAPECPYDPNLNPNQCPDQQPQACIDNCQVPNGCDCFGCCTIEVDGVEQDLFLGAEDCSLQNIQNCPACEKQESCENPCDPNDCELCFGEEELPPECEEPTCPEDKQPCLQDSDCPEIFFCQAGCCDPVPA